jgi:hypothetical protein
MQIFIPRKSSPPIEVAETREELATMVGQLVPGEQCDRCGGSCYRVDRVGHGSPEPIFGFSARCVDDPEGEFVGCGIGYPIHTEAA